MIQGGDITHHDGTGGKSIYGYKFTDENFKIKHFTGCLSMANSGKDANESQFFITTAETPWLNDKHVVFGAVLSGIEVVQQIERLQVTEASKPLIEAKIINSGEL